MKKLSLALILILPSLLYHACNASQQSSSRPRLTASKVQQLVNGKWNNLDALKRAVHTMRIAPNAQAYKARIDKYDNRVKVLQQQDAAAKKDTSSTHQAPDTDLQRALDESKREADDDQQLTLPTLLVATNHRLMSFSSNDGQLTQVDSQKPGGGDLSCHPSGDFVALAGGGSGSVAVHAVAKKGKLTPITTFLSEGTDPRAVAYDPMGQYLAVTNSKSALTKAEEPVPKPLKGSYVDRLVINAANAQAKLDAANKGGIVLNSGDISTFSSGDQVSWTKNGRFSVSEGTSLLNGLDRQAWALAFHPSGQFLAAGCRQLKNKLNATKKPIYGDIVLFDSTNPNALTVIEKYLSTAFPSWILNLIYDPSGQVLIAINSGTDDLSTFDSTNPSQLAKIGQFPTHGEEVSAIACNPAGTILAAANKKTHTVTTFQTNQGNLAFIDTFQTGGQRPCALAYDPLGRVLAVANQATKDITTFADDQGQLSVIGTFSTTRMTPHALSFKPMSASEIQQLEDSLKGSDDT